MFDGAHVQTGAGRYVQCHGALKRLGQEVAYYVEKIAVLYGDETIKAKTGCRIEESLKASGLEYKDLVFE